MTANIMLSNARIECIGFNRVAAALKPEVVMTHEQVHKPRHVANTAIALRRFNIGGRVDLESNPAAMTAASMYRHDALRDALRLHTASRLFAGMA